MKKTLVLLFVALSFVSNAQFKNVNEAINVAGRQRMLSQKMAKAFLLISADINTEKYQNELDNSLALFEESHQLLRSYCEEKSELNSAMESVEELWYNFREVAVSTEFKESECSYLLTNSSHLLKMTNNVVELLEKSNTTDSDKHKGKLVNMAGRQRMLTQKIGLYYIATYLEISSPEIKPNFEEAVKLFDSSLKELMAEKEIKTEEITKKLNSVSRNWKFTAKSLNLDGKLKPAIVSISLNNLLKDMNTITGWYAAK